ncbi:uncharacterized protein LOC141690242 [Apium graveolens]|uniref:uncharacterized protein LOC141690242 n=1 Tax=Apium graveolens TaxID=4045 RepID=UPI003D7A4865
MESQIFNDSAPNTYADSEIPPSFPSPLLPKNLTKLNCEDDAELFQISEEKPDDLTEQFLNEIVEDTPLKIIEQYVKHKKRALKPKKLQFEDPTGMLQIYLSQIVYNMGGKSKCGP